jgi:hypothetical protein
MDGYMEIMEDDQAIMEDDKKCQISYKLEQIIKNDLEMLGDDQVMMEDDL